MSDTSEEQEPFMKAACNTCRKVLPVCCGDLTNGFWCENCCPNPYDDETDDYDEDDEFDCHRGPDGSCGLAGTEECDWDVHTADGDAHV